MQSDSLGDLGLIIGQEGHEWLVMIIKGMSPMSYLEKEGLVSIKKLSVNTCPHMEDSLLPLYGGNSVNRLVWTRMPGSSRHIVYDDGWCGERE